MCEPVCLADLQLNKLVEELMLHTPKSISTIAVVHNIRSGRLEGKVCTDKWPEFSAVICSYNCPGYSMVNLVCFATTLTSQKDLLHLFKCKLLTNEWGRKLFLHGVGDALDYLKESLESDQKAGIAFTHLFEGYELYLPQLLPKERIPDSPDGFIVRKLEDHHAEFVSSNWDYFAEDKELFFKGLIRNFYSVGLFAEDDPDKPVAWCMQYPFGQPAHVYVLEKYRRRGFASLMYAHICRYIQAEGFIPAISTDVENPVAEGLGRKVGFVKYGQFKEMLITILN